MYALYIIVLVNATPTLAVGAPTLGVGALEAYPTRSARGTGLPDTYSGAGDRQVSALVEAVA